MYHSVGYGFIFYAFESMVTQTNHLMCRTLVSYVLRYRLIGIVSLAVCGQFVVDILFKLRLRLTYSREKKVGWKYISAFILFFYILWKRIFSDWRFERRKIKKNLLFLYRCLKTCRNSQEICKIIWGILEKKNIKKFCKILQGKNWKKNREETSPIFFINGTKDIKSSEKYLILVSQISSAIFYMKVFVEKQYFF